MKALGARMRAMRTQSEAASGRGSDTNPDQSEPDPFPKTGSNPKYVKQVRKWMDTCDKLHKDTCVPKVIPQWPPEDVPRWLVDTQQQCIVPGLSVHRYLALSYVWPETRASPHSSVDAVPRSLLLDNANLTDFQMPGFLGGKHIARQIPMVIRHAEELCRALGERYLWVDRICIVQNDVGDGGTLSQVAKMDKIYAGAYLTIIAAGTEEMYGKGLTLEWPLCETGRLNIRQFFNISAPPKSTKLNEEDLTRVMSARYAMLSLSIQVGLEGLDVPRADTM